MLKPNWLKSNHVAGNKTYSYLLPQTRWLLLAVEIAFFTCDDDCLVCTPGKAHETSCAGNRHNVPRPSPPSMGAEAPRAAEPTAPADHNVVVGSHSQYVPTVTAAAG